MAYNTIRLNGKQICDYLYIQTEPPSEGEFSHVNDEPTEWKTSTKLFAGFNDKDRPLSAGDSKLVGEINGYEVYRRKYNESRMDYIGTIKKAEDTVSDLMVDYAAKNGTEYIYYLYPDSEVSESGVTLSPLSTEPISLDCDYWALLIVDETEEENVFYLDKMFKFELNLEIDDLTNNAQVSIVQNFTKYPTVQYGGANYWSGSLSALCGFIAANGVDYVQTPNMIDELKSLSLDTRKKFLKDTEGNLWEVNVSAAINISTQQTATKNLKTLKFSWVEVGSADNVSIINDPRKPLTDWVLTDSGEVIPYFTYVWGDQYRWDNSRMWTANEGALSIKNKNLGRDITQ